MVYYNDFVIELETEGDVGVCTPSASMMARRVDPLQYSEQGAADRWKKTTGYKHYMILVATTLKTFAKT